MSLFVYFSWSGSWVHEPSLYHSLPKFNRRLTTEFIFVHIIIVQRLSMTLLLFQAARVHNPLICIACTVAVCSHTCLVFHQHHLVQPQLPLRPCSHLMIHSIVIHTAVTLYWPFSGFIRMTKPAMMMFITMIMHMMRMILSPLWLTLILHLSMMIIRSNWLEFVSRASHYFCLIHIRSFSLAFGFSVENLWLSLAALLSRWVDQGSKKDLAAASLFLFLLFCGWIPLYHSSLTLSGFPLSSLLFFQFFLWAACLNLCFSFPSACKHSFPFISFSYPPWSSPCSSLIYSSLSFHLFSHAGWMDEVKTTPWSKMQKHRAQVTRHPNVRWDTRRTGGLLLILATKGLLLHSPEEEEDEKQLFWTRGQPQNRQTWTGSEARGEQHDFDALQKNAMMTTTTRKRHKQAMAGKGLTEETAKSTKVGFGITSLACGDWATERKHKRAWSKWTTKKNGGNSNSKENEATNRNKNQKRDTELLQNSRRPCRPLADTWPIERSPATRGDPARICTQQEKERGRKEKQKTCPIKRENLIIIVISSKTNGKKGKWNGTYGQDRKERPRRTDGTQRGKKKGRKRTKWRKEKRMRQGKEEFCNRERVMLWQLRTNKRKKKRRSNQRNEVKTSHLPVAVASSFEINLAERIRQGNGKAIRIGAESGSSGRDEDRKEVRIDHRTREGAIRADKRRRNV